jgi:hypothetical protein
METKVSKAQLEVWEWKEKLYQQVKDLHQGEMLKFILGQTKETIDNLKDKQKIVK